MTLAVHQRNKLCEYIKDENLGKFRQFFFDLSSAPVDTRVASPDGSSVAVTKVNRYALTQRSLTIMQLLDRERESRR